MEGGRRVKRERKKGRRWPGGRGDERRRMEAR